MTFSFIQPLAEDKTMRDRAKAAGRELEEVRWVFPPPGGRRGRRLKRTLAEWEMQATETLDWQMREMPIVLFICSHGVSPWSEQGRELRRKYESGDMKLPDNDGQPKARTPAEVKAELNRKREEARTGVRLEPASKVIRIER